MNLVNQRLQWREEMEQGKFANDSILNTYKSNRFSERWRISYIVEYLCEHIMFLEDKLKALEEKQ